MDLGSIVDLQLYFFLKRFVLFPIVFDMEAFSWCDIIAC